MICRSVVHTLSSSPRQQKLAASRRAAVIVEFALIAPLFVAFTLGMIELSRGIMVKQILSDAARRACRLGTLSGNNNSSLTNDIVKTLQDNNINSANVNVTILVNGVAADVSAAQRHDKITVQLSLPYADVAWVTPLILLGTIESESLSMIRHL